MEQSINEELVRTINNEKELHRPILYINHPDFVRINNIIYSVWKDKGIKEWNPAFHEIDFKDLASGKKILESAPNDITKNGKNTLPEFLRKVYNDDVKANCIVLRNVLSYFQAKTSDQKKSRIELITYLQLISQKILHQEGYDKTIVVLSDEEDCFPDELLTYTRRFDRKDFIPTDEDIKECITDHYTASGLENLLENKLDDLVKQYRGLQLYEIDHLIDMDIYYHNSSNNRAINEEKNAIVNASGFFEIINAEKVTKANIQGYSEITKNFDSLQKRNNPDTYKEFFEPYGIPKPKGYLLYGPPGCGKSEMAKVIANKIGLADKLYKLDIGKLMGQYVGQSEKNLKRCLDIVEAAAPCVLWIDEIEKALAGTSSGKNEEAYSMRMLQTLLSWMQERDSFVFIVATANELKLKPELIRKGRFDNHFEVGYPSDNDAKLIFEQYLFTPKERENYTKNIEVKITDEKAKDKASKDKDWERKPIQDKVVEALIDKAKKEKKDSKDKKEITDFSELEMSGAFIKAIVEEYIIRCIDEKDSKQKGKNNTPKETFVDFVWKEFIKDKEKRKKNEQDNQ